MGRATLLTPDLIDQIVGLVKLGNYPLVAARACGVSANTWYDWMARGREAIGEPRSSSKRANGRNGHAAVEVIDLFVKLVNAIDEAEAFTEARTVGTLVVAANSDAKAAVTFLERRYPQRWRQHVTTEMVGPDGGPVKPPDGEAKVTIVIADTLAGILEAMARAGKLPKLDPPKDVTT